MLAPNNFVSVCASPGHTGAWEGQPRSLGYKSSCGCGAGRLHPRPQPSAGAGVSDQRAGSQLPLHNVGTAPTHAVLIRMAKVCSWCPAHSRCTENSGSSPHRPVGLEGLWPGSPLPKSHTRGWLGPSLGPESPVPQTPGGRAGPSRLHKFLGYRGFPASHSPAWRLRPFLVNNCPATETEGGLLCRGRRWNRGAR